MAYPTDEHQEEAWPMGWGELTPVLAFIDWLWWRSGMTLGSDPTDAGSIPALDMVFFSSECGNNTLLAEFWDADI